MDVKPREKETLISKLTPELNVLRTKAGISQGELADLAINYCRAIVPYFAVSPSGGSKMAKIKSYWRIKQTYGAIERGTGIMAWNTYMSLIMFYDYDAGTHNFIRKLEIFSLN